LGSCGRSPVREPLAPQRHYEPPSKVAVCTATRLALSPIIGPVPFRDRPFREGWHTAPPVQGRDSQWRDWRYLNGVAPPPSRSILGSGFPDLTAGSRKT
jgi:hypothetical protein